MKWIQNIEERLFGFPSDIIELYEKLLRRRRLNISLQGYFHMLMLMRGFLIDEFIFSEILKLDKSSQMKGK